MTTKRRKNYLNNKDMLKEIHLSKITFCTFKDKLTDNQQDFIVNSREEIFDTKETTVGKDEDGKPIIREVPVIELARQARAARLTKEGIPTEPSDVATHDIVFRVMTNEHIPLVAKKKSSAAEAKAAKKAKANAIFEDLLDSGDDDDTVVNANDTDIEMVPMRVNFPPFFHYRIKDNVQSSDVSDHLELVGKSHWKGDLETGAFCKTHGRTTDNLALMYIKLCERYGTRSNWRGYTYNDEMQGQALVQLTQVGLQFNEQKSQNPFAYYTATVTNSFTRVLNIEKRMQEMRDDILEANGLSPSWTRQLKNEEAMHQNHNNED